MAIPALKQHYQDYVIPELKKSGKYENAHELPQIMKVVINSGFDATLDKNQIAETQKEISSIAGQQAVVTKARLSISNFKLREGMPVGVMVTLRGVSMYEFLHRLIGVALPGIRDFRGVHEKLDGNGNYALGIADHTIFPEVNSDGSKRQIGMDICIVTSATTNDEGKELLRLMGMPFRKRQTTSASAA